VPPNTAATVVLPPRAGLEGATEGGRPLQQADGILGVKTHPGNRRIEVGSGKYRFEFPWR